MTSRCRSHAVADPVAFLASAVMSRAVLDARGVGIIVAVGDSDPARTRRIRAHARRLAREWLASEEAEMWAELTPKHVRQWRAAAGVTG